jgi:hypothetical protein
MDHPLYIHGAVHEAIGELKAAIEQAEGRGAVSVGLNDLRPILAKLEAAVR